MNTNSRAYFFFGGKVHVLLLHKNSKWLHPAGGGHKQTSFIYLKALK